MINNQLQTTSNSESLNMGGRVKTMAPFAGGVRRVNHSTPPVGTDNSGFIPVKVLIICFSNENTKGAV